MQMLMTGDTLTTNELMYLQKFDNLKHWEGQKVPMAAITHYDCYQQYKKGDVVLYDLRRFQEVLNWNEFPIKLLKRFL